MFVRGRDFTQLRPARVKTRHLIASRAQLHFKLCQLGGVRHIEILFRKECFDFGDLIFRAARLRTQTKLIFFGVYVRVNSITEHSTMASKGDDDPQPSNRQSLQILRDY
jgi:hypothetical protein